MIKNGDGNIRQHFGGLLPLPLVRTILLHRLVEILAVTHEKRMELRVPSALAVGAKREAERRGVTLSELVRDALRRSLSAAA